MKTFYGIAVALALTISPPVLRFCAGAEEDPHLIGQFLVAAPTMGDPRFQESVVYLIGHGAEGALGFVVNHPIAEGPLSDLLKALGRDGEAAKGSVTIDYGGPVEGEELFVLHSNDYTSKATRFVGNGLGVTSDQEILRAIARGEGPRQKLFIFGYAAWGPGQLEAEIDTGAWFTISAEPSLIFSEKPETIWQRALAKRKLKT